MILVPVDARESEPFTIKSQVTIFASGLQASDVVEFDVVSVTKSRPSTGDVCCPGAVSLPALNSTNPLKSCTGQPIKLTADRPWIVMDMPQQVPLRARVVADDDAVIEVEYFETTSAGVLCV